MFFCLFEFLKKKGMNVIFGDLWTRCDQAMQAFVIMHLLTGEEAKEPWCVLLVEGVQSENQVIQLVLQEADVDASGLKLCFVDTLPFLFGRRLNKKVVLVACFE